eukprot:1154522-Pelagomonas_calceolata.AAC.2
MTGHWQPDRMWRALSMLWQSGWLCGIGRRCVSFELRDCAYSTQTWEGNGNISHRHRKHSAPNKEQETMGTKSYESAPPKGEHSSG